MGAYAFEVEGVRLDRMAAFGHLSQGSRAADHRPCFATLPSTGCKLNDQIFWSFSLHPVDGRVAKHGR